MVTCPRWGIERWLAKFEHWDKWNFCLNSDILLAREAYFPGTIADLYVSENMAADLRAAHERNDEVLERIYIGRRFKNDTEQPEKLFALYTEMTAKQGKAGKAKGRGGERAPI